MLIWQTPDPRSLIFFVILLVAAEIFIRVRYRHSLRCPHCGFDPILYKQNKDEAAARVKSFLEMRKNDPKYLLKPQPKIKPVIKKSDDWRKHLAVQVQGDVPVNEENPPPSPGI